MDDSRNIEAACVAELKILQRKGVKTAIRLEAIYWSQLRDFAGEDKTTLSKFVHGILDAHQAVANRTSLLRCYCLDRTRKRVSVDRLQGQTFDVMAIIAACPAPVAVITPERKLAAFNPAFGAIISDLRQKSGEARAIQLSFSEQMSAIQRRLIEQPMRVAAYQIGIRVGEGAARYFDTRFALADRGRGLESSIIAFLETAQRR